MKMIKRIVPLVFVAGLFCWTGCYYDVEEVLYPSDDCDTTMVSFSADIVPVLQESCYECHSGSVLNANVDLEGHGNVKHLVELNKLLGVIRHDPGFDPMPQGAPKIQDCDILKIEAWVADGTPDN